MIAASEVAAEVSYVKFTILADIRLIMSCFCCIDGDFCEGGFEGCEFRSGDGYPDGGGAGDHLGHRIVQGQCRRVTESEPQ